MSSYKQRLQQITDELFEQVVAYRHEPSSRRPNLADHPKIQLSIEKLIRDSVAIRTGEARIYLATIHKDSHYYTGKAVGRRIHLKRVYLGLLHFRYLKKEKGGWSNGVSGGEIERYSATPKLLKMFGDDLIKVLPALIGSDPIEDTVVFQESETIYHDDRRPTRKTTTITPIETDELQTIRNKVTFINKAIDSLWIDLEMSEDEQVALARKMRSKRWQRRNKDARPYVRLTKRLVYRVFNNAEMTRGGRFYGGFWTQIPKEARQRIVVDGKRMVELDYSGLHPTILYNEKGLDAPPDPYTAILDKLDLKDQPITLPNEPDRKFTRRDSMKVAFNTMINASRQMRRPPNGIHLGLLGKTWKQVEAAVIAVFQPIAEHFYNDTGSRLQRIDSDIAQEVLLHFAQHPDGRVPCLPVHDSFLIHHGYEQELKDIMDKMYERKLGFSIKIKAKYAEHECKQGWLDMSISSLLECDKRDYEQRLQAFRQR